MDNNFKNNIKHLRTKYSLTQNDLAKKFNKDYTTIGKWENGERTPSTKDIMKIAKFFDVSVDKLILGDLSDDLSSKLDKEIISKLDKLNDNQKKVILDVINNISGKEE